MASWFADLYPSFDQPSSLSTIQAFTATFFFVYALVIAQIGQLAQHLGRAAELKKSFQLISGFGSQLLLIMPFFIENLLKLYSLAFVGALSVTLAMVLFLLKRQTKLAAEDNSRGGIVISLGLLILSISYPTFLLVGFFMLIIFLCQPSITHTLIDLVQTRTGKMTVVLMSFCLSNVVVQVMQAAIPSSLSAVSRFSASAHITAISGKFVLTVSLLSITSALFFYKRRLSEARLLFLFLTPVLLTVIGSWLLSNSFDRSYGPNYYAKKSEYQLVVLLAPLAFCGFFQVVEWLARLTKTLNFVVIAFVLATALSTPVFLRDGLFGVLIGPTISNRTESKLMTYALQEAEIDGRSIIWDESQPYFSQYASMMSVQIDPTSWLEPDVNGLFLAMAQQLPSHDSTLPWINSCSLVRSRNFGDGRILDINKSNIIDC